jgi:hypothetical protein
MTSEKHARLARQIGFEPSIFAHFAEAGEKGQ